MRYVSWKSCPQFLGWGVPHLVAQVEPCSRTVSGTFPPRLSGPALNTSSPNPFSATQEGSKRESPERFAVAVSPRGLQTVSSGPMFGMSDIWRTNYVGRTINPRDNKTGIFVYGSQNVVARASEKAKGW